MPQESYNSVSSGGGTIAGNAFARFSSFERKFGRQHAQLAMHAAFPLGLTPELLHLIRLNFVPQAPWIAEADLLLSPLCQDVGGGSYEMDHHIREFLIFHIRRSSDLGQARIELLAEFLYAYASRELVRTAREDRELRHFLTAQQWAALAYAKPQEAAASLAEALKDCLDSNNRDETLRIARLADALTEPLISEEKVLLYAAGIESLATGDAAYATDLFDEIGPRNQALVIGSVTLHAPAELPKLLNIPLELPVSQEQDDKGLPPPDSSAQTAVIDLPRGITLRNNIVGTNYVVEIAAWSPDGRTLAISTGSSAIHLWSEIDGQMQRTPLQASAEIRRFAWSQDSSSIMAGLTNNEVWIWRVNSTEPPRVLSDFDARIDDVIWSPDQRWIAVACLDGFIYLRDTRIWSKDGPVLREFDRFPNSIAWSPAGANYLIAGYTNGYVIVWDTVSWNRRRTYHGRTRVNSVAISPSRVFIAAGTESGAIHIWRIDESDEEYHFVLEGHTMAVTCICFSSKDGLLASKSNDGSVRLWRSPDWQCVAVIIASAAVSGQPPLPSSVLAFHPSESLLATCIESNAAISVLQLDVQALRSEVFVPDEEKPKRTRLFLSCRFLSESDRKVAQTVIAALGQHYEIASDEQAPIGTSLSESVIADIRSSEFLIVFLTTESVQNPLLRETIDIAYVLNQSQRRPIIMPVRLAYRETLPFSLNRYLERQYNLSWEGDHDTERLIGELSESIEAFLKEPSQHEQSRTPLQELPSGGAMRPDSPFYIERETDRLALDAINRQGAIIVIQGAHQIGKSSLLARMLESAYQAGKRVATIDFQLFDSEAFNDPQRFSYQFCARLNSQLGLRNRMTEFWHESDQHLSFTQRCTSFVESVLGESTSPLVLAIEEVDRIFNADFRNDFFRMLRVWHNTPSYREIWQQCTLIIITSISSRRFMEDSIDSPFDNIISPTKMKDFTSAEVEELNRRYGLPLNTDEVKRLVELLAGHPYLTQQALYLVANKQYSTEELLRRAPDLEGPFGEHLRGLRDLFFGSQNGELIWSFGDILASQRQPEPRILTQLESAGLVRIRDGKAESRCALYAEFVHRHVGT